MPLTRNTDPALAEQKIEASMHISGSPDQDSDRNDQLFDDLGNVRLNQVRLQEPTARDVRTYNSSTLRRGGGYRMEMHWNAYATITRPEAGQYEAGIGTGASYIETYKNLGTKTVKATIELSIDIDAMQGTTADDDGCNQDYLVSAGPYSYITAKWVDDEWQVNGIRKDAAGVQHTVGPYSWGRSGGNLEITSVEEIPASGETSHTLQAGGGIDAPLLGAAHVASGSGTNIKTRLKGSAHIEITSQVDLP